MLPDPASLTAEDPAPVSSPTTSAAEPDRGELFKQHRVLIILLSQTESISSSEVTLVRPDWKATPAEPRRASTLRTIKKMFKKPSFDVAFAIFALLFMPLSQCQAGPRRQACGPLPAAHDSHTDCTQRHNCQLYCLHTRFQRVRPLGTSNHRLLSTFSLAFQLVARNVRQFFDGMRNFIIAQYSLSTTELEMDRT